MDEPEKRTANEGVDELVDDLLREHSGELSAPVWMPPKELLTVKMVPLSLVRELDEERGRASRWIGIGSFSTSVPVGMAVNWLTDGAANPSEAATVVLAVFSAIALIAWVLALVTLLRARRARAALLAFGEKS